MAELWLSLLGSLPDTSALVWSHDSLYGSGVCAGFLIPVVLSAFDMGPGYGYIGMVTGRGLNWMTGMEVRYTFVMRSMHNDDNEGGIVLWPEFNKIINTRRWHSPILLQSSSRI